jgi:hypothetical protein
VDCGGFLGARAGMDVPRYGRAYMQDGCLCVCSYVCVLSVGHMAGCRALRTLCGKNEAKAQKRPQMGRSRQYARQVFTTDSQDRHWDVMIVKIVKIIS